MKEKCGNYTILKTCEYCDGVGQIFEITKDDCFAEYLASFQCCMCGGIGTYIEQKINYEKKT